ncbi:MAG: DUF434 domain-containing protein [Sulfolobaceae archaeon]
MKLREELVRASEDYKYLLNRGYSRKLALFTINARYNLSNTERNLLYRCIHSDEELKVISQKLRDINSLSGEIVIDGYNIALTLLSIFNGDPTFICDDGFIRDINLGKLKNSDTIADVLLWVIEKLNSQVINVKPAIILDSQISRSGEIAKSLRERKIKVILSRSADKDVILSNSIVCSNDFLVILKSHYVVNLIPYLLASEENIIVYSGPWSKTL